MKQMINEEHIEGKLYSHTLVMKKVQNENSANFGKDFISGEINIATDESLLNIITVHYTYVTEKTAKGKDNRTFKELNTIINSGVTIVENGWDKATCIKADPALALNDFWSNQKNEMVSVKRNEGGFATIVSSINENKAMRNTFSCDMLITAVKTVEANEEKNIPMYVAVNGYVFNFKNEILPVEFVVHNEQGIKYFEGLEVSNSQPIFTKVWGKIVSTIIKEQTQEESGFGEALIKTVERKSKEWVITGIAPEGYDLGDEKVLTSDEVKKALADREIALADIKKRNDEYQASKSTPSENGFSSAIPKSTTAVNNSAFKF